jgi:putative endonuclease
LAEKSKEKAGEGLDPPLYALGENMEKTWYVYILECGDGTLYTGITDDVQRRLQAHRSGKGAKYTRGRSPLTLRYQEACRSYSEALRREIQIKKLPREVKLDLIRQYSTNLNAINC